jgi:hypothetical protein
MPVTYPIQLPREPGFRRVTSTASAFDSMTRSPFTGAQQIQRQLNRMWRFSVELPPMDARQARAWHAALLSLDGMAGTFLFGDPVRAIPQGTWEGQPFVNGTGQTGQTLALSGFTPGATIFAGDQFQISTGAFSRLHMATLDAVANGSGEATIDIWPAHRSPPGGGDPIRARHAQGVFRLASGDVAMSWQPFAHGLTFDAVEAF